MHDKWCASERPGSGVTQALERKSTVINIMVSLSCRERVETTSEDSCC